MAFKNQKLHEYGINYVLENIKGESYDKNSHKKSSLKIIYDSILEIGGKVTESI